MAEISHVVVLMLENRSFDHMLGFLDHPDPAYESLTRGGPYDNPGWRTGERVQATPEAKPVLPVGPGHTHAAVMEQLSVGLLPGARPTNQGFVTSYEREGRGLSPPVFGGLLAPLLNAVVRLRSRRRRPVTGRGPLVMLCQPPRRVPVLAALAREFAVCTRWFCSVPGETWPNRNFAHAATSDGETEIVLRPYYDETIFERLERSGHSWRIYHEGTPQAWAFPNLWDTPARHANWFPLRAFAEHVAASSLPAYSFLEPDHFPPVGAPGHSRGFGIGTASNNQHPENNLVADADYDSYDPDRTDNDFHRAEALVAHVYEALRSNRQLFARTVLLVTYDEHGGLYDHVPPPTGVPSPGRPSSGLLRLVLHALAHGRSAAFDFTMLGPRVPAVVVSPHVARGTVDTAVRDHASIPATLRAVFVPDAPPLTPRDAWAAPFHRLLTLAEPRTDLPDLSSHVRRAAVDVDTERAALASLRVDTAAGTAAGAPVPPYYQAFLGLADDVHEHLVQVGEPEVSAPRTRAAPADALQTTEAFVQAAERHRGEAAGGSRRAGGAPG